MNKNNSEKVNSVFYAKTYHPIQAGSIDGTDILPHDNAVYRALLCSSANLYDQFGDVKVIGGEEGGYTTVFVGRLNRSTNEDTLRKAMSKYGTVKNLRLVRHIVTGASQGYAFVEYESEREMRRAYEKAHRSIIDDSEVIVDYNRQQLMPGWIPRRLGGGLGGKKESGQLRFGGRERPFRAPLRPIPYDDLKRLGIPPPPEGNYMSRFEVPSPPRRETCDTVREDEHSSRSSRRRDRRSSSRDHLYKERESMETEDVSRKSRRHSRYYSDEHDRRSKSRDRHYDETEDSSRKSRDSRRRDRRSKSRDRQYDEREDSSRKSRDSRRYDRRSKSRDRQYDEREDSRDSRRHDRRSNSRDPQYDEREDSSRKSRDSRRHDRTSTSPDPDHLSERRDSSDREERSHKRHRRE